MYVWYVCMYDLNGKYRGEVSKKSAFPTKECS